MPSRFAVVSPWRTKYSSQLNGIAASENVRVDDSNALAERNSV
jgi:hypothetical protein